MRLLADHEQKELLKNICGYLREKSNFMLPDCRVHVQVIDGKTEALYGWIAANYLLGGFDKPGKHDHGKGHHTYGFLDMGGASAQIAFAPNATESKKHANDLTLLRLRTLNGEPEEHRVFVTSWLGFGVRQARNRYVKELLSSGSQREHPDPCLPSGVRTTVDGSIIPPDSQVPDGSAYLLGTGNFESCLHRTVPLLEKDVPCEDEPCLLNGVHVPAIDFEVNHFVGISEYWHTTHEIFEMGHKDKAYDFHTYQLRVKEFCDQDWKEIEAGISTSKWGKQVDEEKANEVCFKAAWIINMLHDGIGVPRIGIEGTHASGVNATTEIAKQGKDRGFLDPFQAVNKIGSTEVSWTLGKAVLYASSQVPPARHSLPVGFGSNVPGIPDDFQYPASPRLPLPIDDVNQGSNSTAEHWHDALFDGDSPRRIPGVFLFAFIVVLALFFLCGRERRARTYRRINRSLGRTGGSHRKRGSAGSLLSALGRKLPWSKRKGPSYERVLEDGMRDFELGDSATDSEGDSFDATSSTTPVGLSKSSSSIWGHNQTLKYGFDNSSSQSLGSMREHGPHAYDRNGLVIRTESRDRLLPVALGPTTNGRRSRATSPVRQKPPFPAS